MTNPNAKLQGDVLVLDDDPLVLMNNCDIIDSTGLVAIAVDTLSQARNQLASREFDLALLDHDLPDGKGIELVRDMTRDGCQTPIIYLSANGNDAGLRSALEELEIVKAILVKPVEDQELLTVIAEHLRRLDNEYPRLIGRDERQMLLGDNLS